jgi:hypothetical protein
MSFEPPTHILRPSGVIGAIKNDGDRLGDIFGMRKNELGLGKAFFFCGYNLMWVSVG